MIESYGRVPSEEEGTTEWFMVKTGAPALPAPLCYRVKMTRYHGIEVRIVDPTRYNWFCRLGKTLVLRQSGNWMLNEDADWPATIGKLATYCFEMLEQLESEKAAKQHQNPYFGDFCARGDERAR